MADRQLKVTLVGDATQLNRTLGRTETKLAAFGKTATKSSGLFGKLDSKSLFAGAAGGAGFFAATAAAETLGAALRQGIHNAASLQKSGEAIAATFGDGAKRVTDFAKSAADLGISQVESEGASARVGLLAKNLGIGEQKAADMAVNMQKLVGSFAEIRGVDPGPLLAAIPLILAGNIRGLNQLGIAVTGAEIKQEAFRLGLTRQGQALSSGAKAQAIYSLATKNLGGQLDLAKQHSGDFANEQHRLSAEISNLEGSIGQLATGPLTTLVTALADAASGALKLKDGLVKLGHVKIPTIHIPIIDERVPGTGNTVSHALGQGLHFGKFALLPEVFVPLELTNQIKKRLAGPEKISAADRLNAENVIKSITTLPTTGKGKPRPLSQSEYQAALKAAGFNSSNVNPLGGLSDTTAKTAGTPKWLVEFRKQLDRLNLSASRAGLTSSLTDDLVVEKKIVGYVNLQAKLHKSNLEVLQAQVSAQGDLLSIQKDQADALRQSAQNLLSNALDKLQGLMAHRQTDRQLEDARRALRVARDLGAPKNILQAKRDLQDALLQKQISQLESARIRPQAGTFTVTIGNISLPGVRNAKQLIAELNRLGKTSTAQTRGRSPGLNHTTHLA